MIKEGNKAPDFSEKNQAGETVKLSSFRNKKNVVLYFYPKDMTPGCTTEACDFRDQHKNLKHTVVLGVSADSEERHRRFIDKYGLPFDLIADENQKVAKKYGVWQKKNFMEKNSWESSDQPSLSTRRA